MLSFKKGLLTFEARKIGRQLPRSERSGAPPRLTKHAMIEVAIQLDLITPEQAEALVKRARRSESG